MASAAETECDRLELERFLPYRLSLLAALVSENLATIYARDYNLGIPEWRVIATLGQFGVTTAKVVGEHSHMQKAKVSRAVAVLTRRKLVDRVPNRQDLREAFLSLSPKGRAVYEALLPKARDFEAWLASALTADERAHFDVALTKLIAHASEECGGFGE